MVFTLPLLEDLRAAYPRAHLVTLSHAQGQGILRHSPAVDEARSDGPLGSSASRCGPRWRRWARSAFTLALTPVRSLRAAWLLWRSGARVAGRLRRRTGGGALHPPRPGPAVRGGLLPALRAAGQRAGHPHRRAGTAPRLRAGTGGRRRSGCGPRAGAAGPWSRSTSAEAGRPSSGRWSTPGRWSRTLAARGQQSLLVGGAQDGGRAQAIAAAAPEAAVIRTGSPVAEAVAELALARAAVGLDSGLSHAGVALGVPTVLLFGPNDPASVVPSPWTRILTQPLPCRPCNRAGKRALSGAPSPLHAGHHRGGRSSTRSTRWVCGHQPRLTIPSGGRGHPGGQPAEPSGSVPTPGLTYAPGPTWTSKAHAPWWALHRSSATAGSSVSSPAGERARCWSCPGAEACSARPVAATCCSPTRASPRATSSSTGGPTARWPSPTSEVPRRPWSTASRAPTVPCPRAAAFKSARWCCR